MRKENQAEKAPELEKEVTELVEQAMSGTDFIGDIIKGNDDIVSDSIGEEVATSKHYY